MKNFFTTIAKSLIFDVDGVELFAQIDNILSLNEKYEALL